MTDKIVYENIALPDTLGELLAVALADARLIEQKPDVQLNMECWMLRNPYSGGVCEVCLAGAVMLQRTPATLQDAKVHPGRWPRETSHKFLAIDALRTMDMETALSLVNAQPADEKARERRAMAVKAEYTTEFGHLGDGPDDDNQEEDGSYCAVYMEEWWEAMEWLRDKLLAAGI